MVWCNQIKLVGFFNRRTLLVDGGFNSESGVCMSRLVKKRPGHSISDPGLYTFFICNENLKLPQFILSYI